MHGSDNSNIFDTDLFKNKWSERKTVQLIKAEKKLTNQLLLINLCKKINLEQHTWSNESKNLCICVYLENATKCIYIEDLYLTYRNCTNMVIDPLQMVTDFIKYTFIHFDENFSEAIEKSLTKHRNIINNEIFYIKKMEALNELL